MKKIVFALMVASCSAQQKDDGDELIMVPKKYLSQDAIAHAAPPPVVEASRWVGVGREIGEAMSQGLGAVVAQADKFGATRVGLFTMTMIAWKVFGDDLKNVALGLPVCFFGVVLWIWSFRKFFVAHRVLVKREGWGKKEWQVQQYSFESTDGRRGCVAIHACFLAVWLLIWVFKIF